jgi:hypothetical protein
MHLLLACIIKGSPAQFTCALSEDAMVHHLPVLQGPLCQQVNRRRKQWYGHAIVLKHGHDRHLRIRRESGRANNSKATLRQI